MSTTPSSPTSPSVDPITVPPAGRPVGHAGARVTVTERSAFAVDGFLALLVGLVLVALAVWRIIVLATSGVSNPSASDITIIVVLTLLAALVFSAVVVIQPGQTKVVQFFGRYVGTARRTGLSMLMPLTTKRKVSVRVNNFETNVLKVNDAEGNPVEIAAIIVWQVADTAKASFAVEAYKDFVKVQSEAALRHVATSHPYDDPDGHGESLRGSTDVVSGELATEVAERVRVAGVEVLEVRISHLAYSPEIAQAMLQRQQASAIIAARSKIVDGAVGMVEMALQRLESQDIVVLDDERKAAMVSNLLVVLCSEAKASPVVNAGSLYH
ncbi:MAG: SPFH domain-containing protein [Candidatus Phosphoribacter baldrii]|jgi:regulator of protease activity HflC (stomatin/prohibitin superfamily)|nr:SPFH domain-containing protein [Candidatus Phosphoribacter baldrii]HRC12821.1 SPFH domain-containing protein [Dermatophilaceae bacterium]